MFFLGLNNICYREEHLWQTFVSVWKEMSFSWIWREDLLYLCCVECLSLCVYSNMKTTQRLHVCMFLHCGTLLPQDTLLFTTSLVDRIADPFHPKPQWIHMQMPKTKELPGTGVFIYITAQIVIQPPQSAHSNTQEVHISLLWCFTLRFPILCGSLFSPRHNSCLCSLKDGAA